MAKGKGPTARRREVRKAVPRPAPSWRIWLTRQEVAWAILWACTITLVAGIIAIVANDRPRYAVGQTLPNAVTPRVEFTAVDQQASRRLAEEARDSEPAVYRPNVEYFSQIRSSFDALLQLAADPSIESLDQIPFETVTSLHLTQAGFNELRQATDESRRHDWDQLVQRFTNGVASLAILTTDRFELERDSRDRAKTIIIQHPSFGWSMRPDTFLYDVGADEPALRESIASLAQIFPAPLRRTATAVVTQNLQPTYLFDRQETERRRQQRYNDEPPVEMTYRPDEVMLPAGKALTQMDVDLLAAERAAYRAQLGPLRRSTLIPAKVAVIALIAAGMWIYLAAYSPRVLANPIRGLSLVVLVLLAQLLAVGLTMFNPQYLLFTATLPTLIAAMILAIAYDQRLALAIGGIHALLVVVSLDLTVGTALTLVGGVGVTVSQLHDIRTRSKLLITGFWTGVGMMLACLVTLVIETNLLVEGQLQQLLLNAGAALVSGLAAGLLVQGILPGVERMFKVTTSMTLKELNDASHPLLRRLAQEAPGTYQHSLRIADMAEAAADAIGANGLLCRVGAMYHDIGKMNKPAYFVENQAGGPNRHVKLSPAMSLLIIVGHVKDGVEMAREYGLPASIRQFIESHHGTTLVEYFFHAAKQKRGAEGGPAPTEFEYRYPGPKPQTREAAILMLCDSVEAIARTLAEPTPVRLEQVMHNMAMKRLMDGQFDECHLTLRELNQIEQAITKTLCAIYHSRIAYPSSEKQPTAPATSSPDASTASIPPAARSNAS